MKKLTKSVFKKELVAAHKKGLDLSIEVARMHCEFPMYSQQIIAADLDVTTMVMFGKI